MVQLSHVYLTTGKTIALPIWSFVGKIMSLLFNMLFRFVIAFSEEQVSFNFMDAVTIHSDFWAQEKKVCHTFHCFPICLHGTGCLDQRRWWQPTPVLLPGKSHGQRSLVGCGPWGHQELDTTEQLHFHFSLSCIGEGNGNPLQFSCLENPRDGWAWWAAVYGVTQSQTRLKRLSSSSSSMLLLHLGVYNWTISVPSMISAFFLLVFGSFCAVF